MIKNAFHLCLLALVLLALSSCKKEHSNAPQNTAQPQPAASPASSAVPAPKREMKMTSAAFADGALMPPKYTCDGENVSPPLKWEGVPDKARTLALFVTDPDAPGKRWTHWVWFNLPASVKELPENVAPEKQTPLGARQGTNDFKQIGYGGPCPPDGAHRYIFKLYALDAELALDAGATKDELLNAMQGHILAQGEMMGKYEKQK